jgi:hypothetical protein
MVYSLESLCARGMHLDADEARGILSYLAGSTRFIVFGVESYLFACGVHTVHCLRRGIVLSACGVHNSLTFTLLLFQRLQLDTYPPFKGQDDYLHLSRFEKCIV